MGKRLYVGNLSWDTNVDTLRAFFGADGRTVTDAHIVSDRETGRPRGFGFVEMDSHEAAISALDGTEMGGRALRVNEAEERRERSGGGFRGGGRGGGGGGGRW